MALLSDSAPPPRILVVYYSRDGHTRRVAQRLAAVCGADVEEIQELGERRGPWGTVRSWLEGLLHMAASIRPGGRNPQDYALVVLGTPVWTRQVASPMRRYLQVQAGRLPPLVATFCTHGGRPGGALEALGDLCQRTPVATLALADQVCDDPSSWRALQRFARELQQRVAAQGGGDDAVRRRPPRVAQAA